MDYDFGSREARVIDVEVLEGTFNDTRDLCFINGVVFIAEHASSLIHFIDLEDKVTVRPRSLKYRADLLSQLARFSLPLDGTVTPICKL